MGACPLDPPYTCLDFRLFSGPQKTLNGVNRKPTEMKEICLYNNHPFRHIITYHHTLYPHTLSILVTVVHQNSCQLVEKWKWCAPSYLFSDICILEHFHTLKKIVCFTKGLKKIICFSKSLKNIGPMAHNAQLQYHDEYTYYKTEVSYTACLL